LENILHKKVAVIIGGTGGIGAAVARRFANAGAAVVVCGQGDLAAAQTVVDSLAGANHIAATASLIDSATLTALGDKARSAFGRTDILVNAAGFTRPVPHGDLDMLDDDLIDNIMKINWRAQFAAIRAFRGLLEASRDGLVVNLSSVSATTGQGSNIAYCAAKAGLDVMTVALARVLAPKIRVLNVSPGVVDTSFVAGRGEDFNGKVAASTPLARIGTPDDIAAAVVACATHLKFSTGVNIVVDGGRQIK
jgi:NAD(P)-dependent dehydrogenase (short-subunit alcohol dehydrogenase family)